MGHPFVHVELNTTDLEKAKTFYRELFEWDLEDVQMGPTGTYTMIKPGCLHRARRSMLSIRTCARVRRAAGKLAPPAHAFVPARGEAPPLGVASDIWSNDGCDSREHKEPKWTNPAAPRTARISPRSK